MSYHLLLGINYQGGLICQAVVEYNGRARKHFLDDLISLDSSQLESIFDSPPGSYLIEKMGKCIQDKKFIEILKKLPVQKFAFGRFGSRGVEGIWKNGNIKLRAALCEILKDFHQELQSSQFGRHVNAKLRVTDYVKSRKRWEENQNGSQNGNGRKRTDETTGTKQNPKRKKK